MPDKTIIQKMRQVDWLGSTLFAGFVTTFVVGLTFGGIFWPWSGGSFIATITVSGVLLVIFVVTQYFSVLTSDPIFPSQMLRSRTMILLYIGTAAAATALAVGTYFIPLYFQFVHQDNALKAAVRLLPFVIVLILFILLNGALLPSTGYYYPWYIAGGIFMTTGGALMYTVKIDSSISKVYGYSVLVAAGAGMMWQCGYVIAQAKVSTHDAAAVISFMNIAHIGNIVLALTLAGTIFQNVAVRNLTNMLSGYDYTAAEIKGAIAGTQSVIFEQGSPEVKTLALKALVGAIDDVFLLIAVGGAVTVLISLGLKREKVDLPKIGF